MQGGHGEPHYDCLEIKCDCIQRHSWGYLIQFLVPSRHAHAAHRTPTWEGSRVCEEPRPINLFLALASCWAASVHVHEVGLAFCAASMQQ